MDNKQFLIAITTYKKNEALKECVQSIINMGLMLNADILVCDDNLGEARETVTQFGRTDIFYSSGPNVGIAKNKNRGIKFFKDVGTYKYLILMDDDITITSRDFLTEFEKAYLENKEHHINMFLGSYVDPLSRKGFFNLFPVISKSNFLYWTRGCQGICSFFTKEIIDKAGYYQPIWPYKYGYEHAEFSARCLKIQGKCPELFPMLLRSYKIIKTQQIPNNYIVDTDKVNGPQSQTYMKYLNNTYNGLDLNCPNHGLDISKEL